MIIVEKISLKILCFLSYEMGDSHRSANTANINMNRQLCVRESTLKWSYNIMVSRRES